MAYEIIPITNVVSNCYLVKAGDSYLIVDTGMSFFRGVLKKTLEKAGCKPGNLKLVIITHGDYDHMGNAAYLQKVYGAKVIVHKSEAGAVEKGDMLSNRKKKRPTFFKMLIPIFRLLVFRSCKPDVYIESDMDLKEYGIDARIICIPGHSTGSIGVLTKEGDFFCGDLMTNTGRPEKNDLIDDEAEMDASIERLKAFNIKTVYPGHGKPFKMEEFLKSN